LSGNGAANCDERVVHSIDDQQLITDVLGLDSGDGSTVIGEL